MSCLQYAPHVILAPMEKLSENLKALIKLHKISVLELARRAYLNQPVIHRLTTGETSNPRVNTLRPLAKYFDITLGQLVGDEPLPLPGQKNTTLKDLTLINLVNMRQAAYWPGNKDRIEYSEKVFADVPVSENAFAVKVEGSAMDPVFPAGTLLIIDIESNANDRDFILAKLHNHGQAIFRQLLTDGEERYLRANNEEFKTLAMGKSDKVVGVMVQARITLSTPV